MSKYDTEERKVMWKPGVFHGLQPDQKGCSKVIAEMARDGWVLICHTEHPAMIGFAHTKLVFRKIQPNY